MFRKSDDSEIIEGRIGDNDIFIYVGHNELYLHFPALDDHSSKCVEWDACFRKFISFMIFEMHEKLEIETVGLNILKIEFTIDNEEVFKNLEEKFFNKEFS